jgi:starch-binding outer membrane protein, SusD/RagB family
MKKYNLIIIALLLLSSCSEDFLNKNPLDRVANETFWNNDKDAVAAASGCYNGFWSMDNVLYFDCASDNAYNPFSWEGFQVQATGYATPGDPGSSFIGYDAITKCNNFLDNISRPKMDETLRKRLTAEVRFLRAWSYFIKVTLYGDVPVVTKVLTIQESNVARTPKADVIKFVLDELTAAAAELPNSYSGNDVGRITKGAALSLKARMQIFDGKYADCATTCSQIMGLGYSLFPDYRGLFKIANEGNSEVILDVQYIEGLYESWVLGVLAPGSYGGWSSINPTQSLADAYECVDGKPITESPLYNPAQPYQNRDPRLDITLLRPGSLYEGSYYDPIDAANNTGDYYAPYGGSKTGYNVRKYVDEMNDFKDVWATGLNAMVIRYAEVLLMYAESKIESNSIDASVYDAIDLVRKRAGMPVVDQTVYNNQTKLRELVRRERRVELAMEGLRWFDICRWKTGTQVMNGMVYGALEGTVSQTDGTLALTTTRIEVETRVFDPAKNYLWPIPQGVIDATPKMVQNPNY